jgi:hypothetical protein
MVPPRAPAAGHAEAWSREVEVRLAEVVAGNVALLDPDEVHAELRADLSRRRA